MWVATFPPATCRWAGPVSSGYDSPTPISDRGERRGERRRGDAVCAQSMVGYRLPAASGNVEIPYVITPFPSSPAAKWALESRHSQGWPVKGG